MSRAPRALRHRDFALLWSGQTTSGVGDGIYTVALALETLRISDHASTLAFVEAARLAPNVLILLLAGALVDRLPRRLVVLGADAARGLAIAAMAGLVAAHALNVAELVVISIVVGVADAFFYPAYQAIIPELLPQELLTQGNAFNSGSQSFAQSLAGPAFGGVLVAAFGSSSAFAIDAASFAISAGCLIAMRAVPAPARSGKSMFADAKDGFRWVMGQPWLWFGILAVSVANFAGFSTFAVLGPLLVRDVLHQGPAAFGAVFAAAGLGAIFAAIVAGRLGTPRRIVTVIWTSWGIASLCDVAMAFSPNAIVVAVLVAAVFGLMIYGNLLWQTMMQTLVPPAMLGRASSVDWLFSISISPIGILVAGAMAGSIGVRETIFAGGLLAAVSCLIVLHPRVRDPERTGQFGAPDTASDLGAFGSETPPVS